MTTTKQSNFGAALRTTILLAALAGLLVVIGALIGGPQTAFAFLIIGLLINLGSYWFSDKIALKMAGARPLGGVGGAAHLPDGPRTDDPRRPADAAALRDPPGAAQRLRHRPQPQARGGRGHRRDHANCSPRTSCAACSRTSSPTSGNRDILIQSVASAIGARDHLDRLHAALVRRRRQVAARRSSASLALVLLAPIAASIIQLAISRQREYSADAAGAEICGNPESLASALLRLEQGAQAIPMQVNQSTEPLYIVKPFSGGGIAGLFSTHPPIEERVRRLRQMRPSL